MSAAESVAATIRMAILQGTFRRGATLPGVRQLAAQLGVNKNTVSKAYGRLAGDGVIELATGRRALVTADARVQPRGEAFFREQVGRVLRPVLWEARLVGLSQDRVVQVLLREVSTCYEAQRRRAVLVECNKIDAQQYARDLRNLLGAPVDWRLITHVIETPANPQAVFAVPFYHLQDVGSRLPADRFAAIHIAPDPAVLLQVIEAAETRRGRVGLVCGNPASVERYSSLFRFYTAHPIRIVHQRNSQMAAVIRTSRALFATPDAFAAVQARAGGRRIIRFVEHIDPASLGALRSLLLEDRPPSSRPRVWGPSALGGVRARR